MIKSKLRLSAAIIVGILLLGIFASTAYATGTAYSNWSYYGPVNGYSYKNQSIVSSTDGSKLEAGETVSNQQNVSVPTGYMGAEAWLYNSTTGSLVDNSGWLYNGAPTPYFTQWTNNDSNSPGGDYYYGAGWTKAWNGSSYPTYQAYNTPVVIYNK
jgi:hypothetical protein